MQNVLQISRKVDYALRAAIHLTSIPKAGRVSFKEIARIEDIPKDFLAKILRTLVNAGIVSSARGPRGGFSLARPPHLISFLEVIEAVEGPILLNICLDDESQCSRSSACAMRNVWKKGQARMLEVFRESTLDQLAQMGLKLASELESSTTEIT